MIDHASSSDSQVLALLSKHPKVARTESGADLLSFEQGGWHRRAERGSLGTRLRGIVELMDNNPLVCADVASVPSASATLALIALGPLAAAGLLVEAPTLLCNTDVDETEINQLLSDLGFSEGVVAMAEVQDLGGAIACTAIAAIKTPAALDEIDDLYEERYGRTFFVRRDETSDWHVSLVLGKPHALYRLRIAPDEPYSLLTIQVMADRQGKCGAAQIVHMMNVMAGLEESLGIQD